ncbi:MAG: hypothetical protein HC906_10280, partial [Bacteroidales bacterium]|nr:hypothetical protein [Bacteroidales bacterium]
SYPQSIAKLESKTINEQEKIYLLYGTIGTGSEKSKVKIAAPKKGIINIIHR